MKVVVKNILSTLKYDFKHYPSLVLATFGMGFVVIFMLIKAASI